MPQYNPILAGIDPQETRRYAGLTPQASFPPDLLKKACQEAKLLAKPQAAWNVYPYTATHGLIASTPATHLEGNSILKHLESAVAVIVLAVTVGATLTTTSEGYFRKNEYTQGLLLDAAATTAVETAADEVERYLASQYQRQGLRLLRRFSPGYGDWDIRVQPHMLTLAGAHEINITTTESCMLLPRKSITAIIGLSPTPTVTVPACAAPSCHVCRHSDCLARRKD